MNKAPQQSPALNPYIGPVPFLEGQTLFGRQRETNMLYDLIVAKRIVLLFSSSGAGKTSLIQAALLPRLKPHLNPLPIIRLDSKPDTNSIQGAKFNRYVFSMLRSLEGRFEPSQQFSDEKLCGYSLGEYFKDKEHGLSTRESSDNRFSLLILDQFEELFTLDRFDWEEKDDFVKQLGGVLGGSRATQSDEGTDDDYKTPPCWALFAMREDHIAEIQPYLNQVPTGFAFRYRLEPLEQEQALEAVLGPAKEHFLEDAAKHLVRELLTLQELTPTGEEKWKEGRFVEPVQLQVVCRRLWDKVVTGEGRPIAVSDVSSPEQKSEVDEALAAYYDSEIEQACKELGIRERDLREWVEQELITATRVRSRALRDPKALGVLDKALQQMVESHVLCIDLAGEREWIELSHDRLIKPVLKSNDAWREKNLALFQKQAKLWAETGKSKPDLLFYGAELEEAEQFAASHSHGLSNDDQQFLQASRLEHKRICDDAENRRQIEAKNARLNKQRGDLIKLLLLACFLLGALGFVFAFFLENYNELNLTQGKLNALLTESRLNQAKAMSRGHRGLDALRILIETKTNIENKKESLPPEFDLTLIEVLGGLPPLERQVGQHEDIVKALQFSADGKVLFSGGWDHKLKVWQQSIPSTNANLIKDQGSDIYSLAYHGSSGMLAATDASGRIVLWRATEGQLEKLSELNKDRDGNSKKVNDAAFNSEGTLLATASDDKRILLWNVLDPSSPARLSCVDGCEKKRYHVAPIYRIAFVQSGKHKGKLISADWDGKIGLWDLSKVGQKPEHVMNANGIIGKQVGIIGMAVSPNGQWLAAGDSDGNVLVWDLQTPDTNISGVRLSPNNSHHDTVSDLAFSKDGRSLLTVSTDETLLRWAFPTQSKNVDDLRKNVSPRGLYGWGEKLHSLALHPSRGDIVAVGVGNKIVTVDLINMDNPNAIARPVKTANGSMPSRHSAVMSSDSQLLAALNKNGERVDIWRKEEKGYQPIKGFRILNSKFVSLTVKRDSHAIAVMSCKEGKLILWQLSETAKPISMDLALKQTEPQTKQCPTLISFSHDGRLLGAVIGSSLHLCSQIDSVSWRCNEPYKFQISAKPTSLAYSPYDNFLALGNSKGEINLWGISKVMGKNNETSRIRYDKLPVQVQIQRDVSALAFHPKEETLISAGGDGKLSEWMLPSLEKVSETKVHKHKVMSLAYGLRDNRSVVFSADGKGHLAMCSGGIKDEQCFRIGRPTGTAINGLAVNEKLDQLVVARDDGLWNWDLRHNAMVSLAQQLLPDKNSEGSRKQTSGVKD